MSKFNNEMNRSGKHPAKLIHLFSPGTCTDSSFIFRLTATIIIINILIYAMIGFWLHKGNQYYHHMAESSTQNMAEVISTNIRSVFERIDTGLFSLTEVTKRQLAGQKVNKAELDEYIGRLLKNLPELFDLSVADEKGNVLYGTNIVAGKSVSIKDRSYFMYLSENPDHKMVLSKLVHGKVSGRWMFVLAKRIDYPDGSFAGTAIGMFDISYFDNLFSELKTDRQDTIELRDKEFNLIAFWPKNKGPDFQIGSQTLPQETGNWIARDTVAATYKETAPDSNIEQMISLRKTDGYPFFVIAANATDDYLRSWKNEVILALIIAAVFTLTTIFFAKILFKSRETELLHVESKRLAEEKTRLEGVIIGTRAGTWEWNVQTGETIFNEHWAEIIGYSLKELAPISIDTWTNNTHPDDFHSSSEMLQKHFNGETDYYDCECRMRHKNGHWVWVLDRGKVISRTHDGKPQWMFGTHIDITSRKLAEEALRKNETYLRTLIHTIPDLVWLKDKDGIYLSCNSKFERLYGAKEGKIIGKTDYDFVDKELADFFREHDKMAIAKGGPSINEEEVTYADDGHCEILETIKTPLYDSDGKLIGVLGIARNITERKHEEEERKKLESQLRQSQKMEAIGTIAGGIAHDFNNILGIIIGNMELAIDSIEECNPVLLNLKEIKKASLRAGDVVRQLLNFSRKTEQSKKIIDIHPMIKESIKLLRSSIPASIDIQMNLPDSTKTIMADPTQIHQVLINLCTNASHAMEKEGGILKIDLSEVELDTVAVSQFPEIQAGQYVQLTISDTGHGIDPEIKTKIFDPYFTTKEIGKGTGMGLAVVLGIVKNHNGAISVYSEPGRGSTFKVLFPAAEGKAVKDVSIFKDLPKGDESILFIDDEAELVEIGSKLLEWLGYKVETGTNPAEALELFRSDPSRFDLIITDMTMPHISGDQLIKEILKIDPEMPVILCTGFSNKIDSERAFRIGAKGYIEKPFDKNQLAYSIRNALDKKR
ncbi:MAG: PAS domain S-box protein [Desulfobacula sp.]